MPLLDRREPAVYVDIEDRSYMEPVIESGRTVYSVILCDRGPSDRIVRITSQKQFHNLFGTPNFLKTSQTHYQIDQALLYTNSCLVTRVVPDDSYMANMAIKENTDGEPIYVTFMFTNGSKDVTMQPIAVSMFGGVMYGSTVDETSECDQIQVGTWIYADGDTPSVAAQVVNKIYDGATGDYLLTLDRPYGGASTIGGAYKFVPFELISLTDIDSPDIFVDPTGDIAYYFYAYGCGKYYNRLTIMGTRNVDLEKMFLDPETDQPLYKYMFMDIGIYEMQGNGNWKMIEGPWTVSLIPRYPDNDRQQVKDPITGRYLYIEDVINSESNFIRCIASKKDPITEEPNQEFPVINKMVSSPDSEQKRLQIMLMFAAYPPLGTENVVGLASQTFYECTKCYTKVTPSYGGVIPSCPTCGNTKMVRKLTPSSGIRLENGTDGTGLYNTAGNIQPDDKLLGKVANAFNGRLTENGIDQIRECVYPIYQPDYVVCGGFPAHIQYAANEIVGMRQDCICLADTGAFYTSYEKDLKARKDLVSWNNFNSMLYTQYRRIFDTYTGRNFWVSPVYHAIARHLYCDAMYFIAEPVAGITKGAIEEPIFLSYFANHTERGDLGDVELNVTIDEPQGKYFLTQYTTWKAFSVLKRAHVVKFTAYLKKVIPIILKDLLQHKATPFWINQANLRLNTLLNRFLNGPVERYSVINSFNVNVSWDDSTSAIDAIVSIRPIRAIERINVTIAVS